MKQNIEFYPHYANSDQHAKFKMLRVQFGWEGEGKFWALNNRIALSEKCCLDISKKYNKAAIANDLNFTLQGFDDFISFLKEDCELVIECEKDVITTDIIQETFNRVMQDRGKARERHRRTSGEKIDTSGEKIDIVKESRIKDIKIKDKLTAADFDKFYQAYPKKKSKGQAKKTWEKLIKQETPPELSTLLSAIEAQKVGREWQESEGKYIPYPATWLNQGCWEDETTAFNTPDTSMFDVRE